MTDLHFQPPANPPRFTEDHKQDRRITWVLALSAVVVVLVGLGTPAVISTSNTTGKVVEAADIQGCRSQANASVTEARTEFDVARATRDTAATHLTVLTNEGLVAGVTGDDETFERILGELNAVRVEVTEAEAVVVDATEHLREVAAVYKERVIQSREDPDTFLRECQAASQ